MSSLRDLLVGSANDLFSAHVDAERIDSAAAGEWPAELWSAVEDQGLHDALVPESAGGSGIDWADGAAVLKAAGYHAAPIPLAESLVATRFLAEAGLERPDGLITVAPDAGSGSGGAEATSFVAHDVPWGRVAAHVLLATGEADESRLELYALDSASCEEGSNAAGDFRDTVPLADQPVASSARDARFSSSRLRSMGALTRVALASGALERILEVSIDYARERVQFGRPIAQFQAVQHQLASMAGEVAAALAATENAAQSFDRPGSELSIAAAKVRVGQASTEASRIAHQVHGAIGFTHEHELHHKTRRLWAWRDEFGTEGEWAERVGRLVIEGGSTSLWPTLSS